MPESLILRDYQIEAVNKILESFRNKQNRPLITMATGTGKTVVFAEVIKRLNQPSLILAHREELLNQAVNKIKIVNSEADVGILQGVHNDGLKRNICVASVQTAVRRLEELRTRNFKICVCDEAHHAAAASYRSVFKACGFDGQDKAKLLLGVTATPYRSDAESLDTVFDLPEVFRADIPTMMQAGYLCKIKVQRIETGIDVSGIKVTERGDFVLRDLGITIDTPERNQLIVDKYIEYGDQRKGVVFCAHIDHAEHLAKYFKAAGISCATIHNNISHDERIQRLRDYDAGRIKLLISVTVLTEGWDSPETAIIIMARPTKSKGLYAQCVGRGLRPFQGKEDCLLLDFADISDKYDLADFNSVINFKQKTGEQPNEEQGQELEEQERARRIKRGAEIYDIDVKEGRIMRYLEYPAYKHAVNDKRGVYYKLVLLNNDVIACRQLADGYQPVHIKANGQYEILTSVPCSLGYAIGLCQSRANKLNISKHSRNDADWRKSPHSLKQEELAKKLDIKIPQGANQGEAQLLIAQGYDKWPAAKHQRENLIKLGLGEFVDLLNWHEAGIIIKNCEDRLNENLSVNF